MYTSYTIIHDLVSFEFIVELRGARRFRAFPRFSGIISDRITGENETSRIGHRVEHKPRACVPLYAHSTHSSKVTPNNSRSAQKRSKIHPGRFEDSRYVITFALTPARARSLLKTTARSCAAERAQSQLAER